MLGGNDQVAAQGRVAPGFARHQLPELGVVRLEPFHLTVDGVARDMWHATGYDAHRLAGVRLDRVDHAFEDMGSFDLRGCSR